MNKEKLLNLFRTAVIIAGVICIGFSLLNLPAHAYSWGFLFLLAFSILIAPRMSLAKPHSNITVDFSDALIFLSFLSYGAETAVLLAALEKLASCYYNKWKGNIKFARHMIAVNISFSTISTAAACFIWFQVSKITEIGFFASNNGSLIASLGILALTQFLVSTILISIFLSLKDGWNLLFSWKRSFFSSSMAQIVGAGIAGIIYTVVNYGDLATSVVALVAFGVVYLTYRQSISEVNTSIAKAEDAEREKAEIERTRRREAEKHASELEVSLEKEEKANEALRKSEKDLQHAALHDDLTSLPNRKHFGDILRKLIGEYKDDSSATFHVMFLDIRKFKNINDSLGHTLGDKVLIIAAKRFARMLKQDDVVARIGGDEFAVILKNLPTAGKAQKVARRIYDSISQPFSLSGNSISITVNIGIAPCDTEYNTPEEVLRDADIAMHYAREMDTGVAVFTKELRVRFLERVRIETDLRQAIVRKELSMNYQPLVSLKDGELMGFEALLRWHHSEFGLVPPDKFIPIAEESGLIIPITVWILQETTRQLAMWQKIRPALRDLIVSVNISGKHLSNDDLIDHVEDALAISKIKPKTLKLEITESAAMENAEHTISVLNRLKHLGVQISIDDFGTGYSSLSYLHRLPFDTLKIDRSFVYSVGEKGEDSEILQTIISLAKNLKKKVIAEGIETESQLSLLQNLGCDYGQGYLISRPQTKDITEMHLYEARSWLPAKISDSARQAPAITEENLPVF